MEKTVSDAIEYRRSVRIFKDGQNLNSDKVKECIRNATLAPNSSNMQLWEFYHITDNQMLEKVGEACLGQNAATTAEQIVVVVVRKDLWKKRRDSNLEFLKKAFGNKEYNEFSKREKLAFNYYKKLMPALYFDFLGIAGYIKYLIFQVVGLFKPVYRQVRSSDMRIVAHKSAGLAAQNFMISMAAKGYDTCPMEGMDSKRLKNALGIHSGAEINMAIGCGIRTEKGVYGIRFRVPFEEIYKEI